MSVGVKEVRLVGEMLRRVRGGWEIKAAAGTRQPAPLVRGQ